MILHNIITKQQFWKVPSCRGRGERWEWKSWARTSPSSDSRTCLRGASSLDFQNLLGFWTNLLTPPPRMLGHQKLKKKVMFIFHFFILGYSKHIIFFMKKSHFLGEKGWDWDTPLPPHLDIVPSLSQVWPPFSCPFFRGSNKLLNWWDIAPPFMYYVFHHIYGQFQGKLSFGQF